VKENSVNGSVLATRKLYESLNIYQKNNNNNNNNNKYEKKKNI
jgi:hypothetical protein